MSLQVWQLAALALQRHDGESGSVLSCIIRSLLRPSDTALVDEPGYYGEIKILSICNEAQQVVTQFSNRQCLA